jgi:hypothetical protein
MNFFDKILSGSIPINVIETIENTKPFNLNEFNSKHQTLKRLLPYQPQRQRERLTLMC